MNPRSLNDLLGNIKVISIWINNLLGCKSWVFITSFFSISPFIINLIIMIRIEKGFRIKHAVIIWIQRVLSWATNCSLAHFFLLLSVSLYCVNSLRVPKILFIRFGSFILILIITVHFSLIVEYILIYINLI